MKIMFLVHSLDIAGAERQVMNLAMGLHRRSHVVSVAAFHLRGAFASELRDAGVTLHSLDKGGRGDVARFALRLVRLIRREKPDILHAYLESPNILSSVMKILRPDLRVVWGVRSSSKDLGDYSRVERLLARIEPLFSRWPDAIIVNSHAGAANAAALGFRMDRLRVVQNGIDTEEFRPDSAERHSFREEIGVGPGELLVGRVGRFHPMKDYPAFLRAAASLHRQNPRMRFLCLGAATSAERAAFTSLCGELQLNGSVHVCEPRRDMRAVYNALDLMVSSSAFGEGFPNVVAEAMACGTPCVVTDVGDSAALLGIAELVAPPGQPGALAKACLRWVETPGLWNSAAARQRIVDQFSIHRLVDRTEQILVTHAGRA